MADELFLRRAVIGGETAPDDYVVIWEGLSIGRIHKTVAVGGGQSWQWSCFLANVPQRSEHRGRVDSLNEAKRRFKGAWAELQSRLSYDEIKAARAAQADRSRPWHK
jgi:hypothetical protein